MSISLSESYERVPYPGRPRPQTHPERLFTLAAVLGMTPPPLEQCRVLEVGCGDGANLIPMALGLPRAEFIGIDVASSAIEAGRSLKEALGLGNIQLRVLDLADFPEENGRFDYIIAHGFYSWVAPPLRDKLLHVMGALLSECGIAFVSYNTYPGCHIREMVREMMLYHVHNAPDPATRIKQARALLKFLADARPGADAYDRLLHEELDRVLEQSDYNLFHDDLAVINQPFYFHQFMEHAERHGLQFLCEAEFHTMHVDGFPEATRKTMDRLGENVLAREQYLDFLRCRRFRQTLLCREGVRLDRNLRGEEMKKFSFSSAARPLSGNPDFASNEEESFSGQRGAQMKTAHPLAKAAMVCLSNAWPDAVSFDALLAGASGLMGHEKEPEDEGLLGEILKHTFAIGLVQPHAYPPRLARSPGERPLASPLARLQAEKGHVLTNLCHCPVQLDDRVACTILRLLDGTRDRTALADALEKLDWARGERGEDGGEGEWIDDVLGELARLALLLR